MHERVEHFMLPLGVYPYIDCKKSVGDAFRVFREQFDAGIEYRNILVLTEKGELLGIISMFDLIRAILPPFLRDITGVYQGAVRESVDLSGLWQEHFKEISSRELQKRLEDIVQPISYFVRLRDPALKALFYMVKEGKALIPVVEEGKVIGVVRFLDIFREITKNIVQ